MNQDKKIEKVEIEQREEQEKLRDDKNQKEKKQCKNRPTHPKRNRKNRGVISSEINKKNQQGEGRRKNARERSTIDIGWKQKTRIKTIYW